MSLFKEFKEKYSSSTIDYTKCDNFKADLKLLKEKNNTTYFYNVRNLTLTLESMRESIQDSADLNFSEIIYLYINNIDKIPICKSCGIRTKFNSTTGFSPYCSTKCANSSSDRIAKSFNTKLERYGDGNYNNIEKTKQTNVDTYGSSCTFVFKRNEIVSTWMLNYGVDNPRKAEKIKAQIKETTLKLYGDVNYNNPDKCFNTKLEKYGDGNYNNPEKVKQTCIEKYGFDSASKHPSVKNKISISLADNYNSARVDNDYSGFVYVVEFPDIDAIKIGLSINPNKRFSGFLSLGKMSILYIIKTDAMYTLEGILHKHFKEYRFVLDKDIGGKTEFFDAKIKLPLRMLLEHVELDITCGERKTGYIDSGINENIIDIL